MLHRIDYNGILSVDSSLWAAMPGVLACEVTMRSYWCERTETLRNRPVVLGGNVPRVGTVWVNSDVEDIRETDDQEEGLKSKGFGEYPYLQWSAQKH